MAPGKLLVLAIVLALPAGARGEVLTLSSKSRPGGFDSQLQVLDNRAADKFSVAIGLAPPRAIIPGTPEALALLEAANSPYLAPARAAAQAFDIPQALFLRLIQLESGWNPRARSPKGALGLAQLMPETARKLRVDPLSPSENLNGGARYLRMMFDRFGTWRLALAAYNAGPEAVEQHRGVPPFAETRDYVRIILQGS